VVLPTIDIGNRVRVLRLVGKCMERQWGMEMHVDGLCIRDTLHRTVLKSCFCRDCDTGLKRRGGQRSRAWGRRARGLLTTAVPLLLLTAAASAGELGRNGASKTKMEMRLVGNSRSLLSSPGASKSSEVTATGHSRRRSEGAFLTGQGDGAARLASSPTAGAGSKEKVERAMAAQMEKRGCNVTVACEACTVQMMNEQVDYCTKTGWRQQLTCRNEDSGKLESKFVSCQAQTSFTSPGPMGVMELEVWCGVFLAGALWFIRRRAARIQGQGSAASDGGGAGGKEMSMGRYAPLNVV
jgi:hypothetical protein